MSVDDLIWLVASLVELAVIGMLIYRRAWRTLPVFFSYCVWDLTSNLAIYAIGRYYPDAAYNALLTADGLIDSALLFCVLIEMAWSVLRPLRASLPRSSMVLVGVLILVAGAAIWPSQPSRDWLMRHRRKGSLSLSCNRRRRSCEFFFSCCWPAAASSYRSAGAIASSRWLQDWVFTQSSA